MATTPTPRRNSGNTSSRSKNIPAPPNPNSSASAPSVMPGSVGIRVAGASSALPRKRRNVAGIVMLAVLACIGLGLGATGNQIFKVLNSFGGSGGAGAAWAGLTRPREQFPSKNRVNILLIGKDYNYVNKKGVNFGILHSREARADTLIFLSLDLDTKRIGGISVPRDTYIASQRGKINGTLAHGGVNLTRKTVGEVLGVEPDFYVMLKPDSVKNIVNLLGGVEVEVKDRMVYNDSWARLHVDLPAGRYGINGDQAVGFVRYRQPDKYERNPDGSPIYSRSGSLVERRTLLRSDEDGDDKRMLRQQQLIKAMATKVKQPQNLWHADRLLDAALGAVETDLTRTQLLALATLFREAKPDQIQTTTLAGSGRRIGGRRGLWVFYPNAERTKHTIDWIVNGNEAAANRLTLVAVENQTSVRGAAGRTVARLSKDGFDAHIHVHRGAAEGSSPAVTQVVYGKASHEARARRIADALNIGTLTKDATLLPTIRRNRTDEPQTADVAVLLGQDGAGEASEPPARGQRQASSTNSGGG